MYHITQIQANNKVIMYKLFTDLVSSFLPTHAHSSIHIKKGRTILTCVIFVSQCINITAHDWTGRLDDISPLLPEPITNVYVRIFRKLTAALICVSYPVARLLHITFSVTIASVLLAEHFSVPKHLLDKVMTTLL
jgi:hypothetical protein